MNDGLRACEEALTRLIKGEPVVSKHVGLSLKKITASIVSLEAGFDRGYLKKSRRLHLPILAKIESCRNDENKRHGEASGNKLQHDIKRAKDLERKLALAEAQRDLVLTQNLQLWVRIRVLELSAKNGGVVSIRDHMKYGNGEI